MQRAACSAATADDDLPLPRRDRRVPGPTSMSLDNLGLALGAPGVEIHCVPRGLIGLRRIEVGWFPADCLHSHGAVIFTGNCVDLDNYQLFAGKR